MKRWPPEVTGALEPGADEVARVGSPPPAPPWCAEATTPEEAEVTRLVARAGLAPVRRRALALRPVLAIGLVTALVLVGVLRLLPQHQAPTTGAATLVEGSILRFGPSITVTGAGDLLVLRSDREGTALELVRGRALFEVDPRGTARHLEVLAAAVTVEVTGTRFSVERDGDRVVVQVERGSVAVHRSQGSLSLHAGERWSQDEERPVPEPPVGSAGDPTAVVALAASGAATNAVQPPSPTPVDLHGGHSAPLGGAMERVAVDQALSWAAILELRARGAHVDRLLLEIERFQAAGPELALAAEAGVMRLQLVAETLPGEEVLPQVDAWLEAHPSNGRALEVELLRATVAREQLEDCALALPSYARVASEADGALREHAQAWLEYCRAEAR